MKDIRRIIKEEIDDLEWMGGEPDYNHLIASFLETDDGDSSRNWLKNSTKYLYRKLDEWDFSVYNLENDASEMVEYGKGVADDTKSVKDRLNDIDGFEDYASIGHMIEDAREGLRFFQPLLDEYDKLKFSDCINYTQKYLNESGFK